jgi:hypothetical protein
LIVYVFRCAIEQLEYSGNILSDVSLVGLELIYPIRGTDVGQALSQIVYRVPSLAILVALTICRQYCLLAVHVVVYAHIYYTSFDIVYLPKSANGLQSELVPPGNAYVVLLHGVEVGVYWKYHHEPICRLVHEHGS